MLPFKSLQFGFVSAEDERTEYPELLTRGFVDPFAAVDQLLHGRRFLVLGEKGTGKSAIREHIALHDDPALFVESGDLADFEFDTIRHAAGHASSSANAWRTVLLLQLVNSIERDTGVRGATPKVSQDWQALLADLGHRGLLFAQCDPPVTRFVQRARRAFKLFFGSDSGGEASFEKESQTERSPGGVPVLAQRIEHTLFHLILTGRHMLVLDGLDDIFIQPGATLETLSSLIRESARLNSDFRRFELPVKIIVLCREDLFEALPGPNTNKIASDRAIRLHWTPHGSHLRSAPLFQLIEKRAKFVSSDADLWSYFPRQIRSLNAPAWLAEQTRFTPRDMVMLMRCIQDVADSEATRLRDGTIMAGVKTYSEDYFLPEIRNQLNGFVATDRADLYFDLLTTQSKREFWLRDFVQHASAQGSELEDAEYVFRALFNAGAVGNVTKKGGQWHKTWRFRNRRARLNTQAEIVVHYGLYKALNLAFRRGGRS